MRMSAPFGELSPGRSDAFTMSNDSCVTFMCR
ncbi:hypothetical protein FOPG_18559 [Fusarium oxysporum f. sp. conglutinans race 2 54008]|uniref:Uncharacterized protein n=1 Tax=Fusarium oxysporum f. sp. conglutinans race 2 54008 TaxID=1089457 RepID=X0GNJ4_FUSOX|nr:hypothetical protein FOPG_18559 [Fusarium oxysporum f. sp. conglutinans race 2 54008]